MPAWVTYLSVRIGVFGGVFFLLVIVGISWWISALLATVISLTTGYIFFSQLRQEVAESLQRRIASREQAQAEAAQAEDSA